MSKAVHLTPTANDQGFVSIIVTLILMIVLTLVVLGFAQLSRREQRTALDQQLNTQAFYAAESGANDFKNYLQQNPGAPSRTLCSQPLPVGLNNHISTNPDVQYTCILYNATLPNLKYDGVVGDQVTVVPITNAAAISKLLFNWNGTVNVPLTTSPAYQTVKSPPAPNLFSTQAAWGPYTTSVLRIMIIPFSTGQNRTTLINNTFTGFLYPSTNSANTSAAYANGKGNTSGVVISGGCSSSATPRGCNATITGLPGGDSYYIVMRSIYNPTVPTHVEIRAQDAFSSQVGIKGAQSVIDVTGKANDVLRRIEVRQPLTPTCGAVCPVGFTSMQPICKQIILDPAQAGTPVVDPYAAPNCTFNFP